MKSLYPFGKTARGVAKACLTAVFPLLFAACSQSPEAPTSDVIATVGDKSLTAAEVRSRVPAGLSEADSLRFVRAFVNSWIDARLISDIASDQVDMTEIDQMVDDYRNHLIMEAYRRTMFERHGGITEDSLREYYDAHRTDFTLQCPMVRGVYLKVPDDAANLRRLRRLYRSDRHDDIDAMEKEVLSSAIHYDYFRDRWVDWEQIESRIPADFGPDATTWPARGRSLDLSHGGYTYLLRLTDVLPAGAPMPYETARPLISQRLLAIGRKTFDARLINNLRHQAQTEGKLTINLPE